jgi:hypothetical protein
MRASSCQHCIKLSIARTLKVQNVLEKLQPYEDKIAEDKANGEDQSLAQKYGLIFEEALIQELLESVGSDVVGRPELDGDTEQTIELMSIQWSPRLLSSPRLGSLVHWRKAHGPEEKSIHRLAKGK